MESIFLAKISTESSNVLIFTDGKKYSLVSLYLSSVVSFADFLQTDISNFSYSLIKLDKIIPSDTMYLDLIDDQPIFATGCTFEWSDEKLQSTSADDVYKKAYLADRSMFFYKGTKKNMTSHLGSIGIRPDSQITIPEAEIVAVFNSNKKIIGYTIGNDVTAVDIEKQNPLFQMQAKFYNGSVALLPLIKLTMSLPITNIYCKVVRNKECIVETKYSTKTFNRSIEAIVEQLSGLGLTTDGGFLFIGCGASYPKDKGLLPNDTIIIKADFLPIELQTNATSVVIW